MKIKSKVSKSTYFEHWSTPLDEAEWLSLNAVLQTNHNVNLFFQSEKRTQDKTYVMTFGRNWPYRLTEEEYAIGCIGKYFEKPKGKPEPPKNRKGRRFRTWKLWGTQYIKDINTNHALSDYKPPKYKDIPQYLIITDDEWIEFICLGQPEWKIHKNMNMKKLISYYMKGSWKSK
jgi:hypothetical protein